MPKACAVARSLAILTLVLLGSMAPSGAPAQNESVRVTVPRANIRAAAGTDSRVLTQVTAGTILRLKAVEGSWFLIELVTGGLRVEGWISSTVATRIVPDTSTRTPAMMPALQGASVAVQGEHESSPLSMEMASIRTVDADAGSIRGLVGVFPADETPASASGASPVTFVWMLPGRVAARVVDDRRPMLLVSYSGLEGIAPSEIAPAVVRLAPTLSGVRLVASVRAQADMASRTQPDWNLARALRQDMVRTTMEEFEPGTVRLQPASSLEPGEYAVVLRLRRNVAGASALSPGGDGLVLSAVWPFSVR